MGRLYGHVVQDKRFATNKGDFLKISKNENLSKKDLRLFVFLCTQLGSDVVIKVESDQIANTLNLNKKQIKDSLENLVNEGIIARASDEKVKKGYVFTYTKNRNGIDFEIYE